MSPRADDDLWPAFVRYLVLGGLVVLLCVGTITLVYDRGLLPIAGPFVALVAVPFFIGLGLLWYATRADSAARAAVDTLATLIGELEQDRLWPRAERSTRAPDDALVAAETRARTAMSQLSFGDHDAAVQTLRSLSKVSAPWASSASVTTLLERLERSRATIEAAVRRRQRQRRRG